jgi:hypothetical protein
MQENINKEIVQLEPITTKRDKKGFRFYSTNNGNTLYAEKNGKIYNVSEDSLNVLSEVPLAHRRFQFVGIVSDEDVKNLYPLYYEYKTFGRVKEQFGMAKGGELSIGDKVTIDNNYGGGSGVVSDIYGSFIVVETKDGKQSFHESNLSLENDDYEDEDDYAKGGVIKVGDTIRIKDGLSGKLMNIEGENLEVKRITEYPTFNGVTKFYHVEYDGYEYDVREDKVEYKKMAQGGQLEDLTHWNSSFAQWNKVLQESFPEQYKSYKLNDWHQWKQLDRLYFLGKTPKQAIDYFANWKKLTNSIKSRMEHGGEIKIGETIRLKKDLPYLASFSNLYNKDLKVNHISETYFASGTKKYYHVEYDGDKYEVMEDFVDNERMEYGGETHDSKILFTINDEKIDNLLQNSNLNYEFMDDDGYLLSFSDYEKFKVMVSDKGYDENNIFVSDYDYAKGGELTTITKEEWSKIPKDYKNIGMDGIYYIMKYDDKIDRTYLQPVKVLEDGGFVNKTDEELKAMSDDELFAYLDAKAAYMKQYIRPLSAYKAKNFAATSKAIEYKNEGTSKLDENFVDIKKINEQAAKDADDYLSSKMASGGEVTIKDAKYTMALAFDNAGFPKAFKNLKKLSNDSYLLQVSSYIKDNETLQNIVKEFNETLKLNFIVNSDSFKKTFNGNEIKIENKTSMAYGGMIPGRYYKDNKGEEYRFVGESRGKLLFKDGEKVIEKSEDDFEDDYPKESKLFGFFKNGGEVNEEEIIDKLEEQFRGKDLWEDEILDEYEVKMFDWEEFNDEETFYKWKNKNSKKNYIVPFDSDDDSYIFILVPKNKMVEGGEVSKAAELKSKIEKILDKVLLGFYKNVFVRKNYFDKGESIGIIMAASNYEINRVKGQYPQDVSLMLNVEEMDLNVQVFGGNGGNRIYLVPDKNDAKEKYLAMAGVKIPFRTPKKEEKFVLQAIEKFAENYKKALKENKDRLMYKEYVDYDTLIMYKGGETTFEDKVKAVQKNLLKKKKVPTIVQKDYGKTYSKEEAKESAQRIIGSQTAKWRQKNKMAKGGKTSVSPLKDRIFGSKKNKVGTASSKTSAKNIELNDSIVEALSEKAKKYNEKHSSKVSVSTLKAVMRRGMGAFSSSHRPGMTRQGWGYARVNKFLLKKGGTKVKAGYIQDDDLLENGGELKKNMKVSDKPKFKKLMELEDRAKISMNKTKNYSKWNETVGNNFRRRWYKMASELRGWDGEFIPMGVKSNPDWIKFTEEQGSVEDYNFGDVLA